MKQILLVLLFSIAGCGGASKDGQKTVLLETGPDDSKERAEVLSNLVSKDAVKAAAILTDGVSSSTPQVAAWAAVYVLRLGIKHDQKKTLSAIVAGTNLDDQLLSALCWRWLATNQTVPLPMWKEQKHTDAVTAIFAALAHESRGVLLPTKLVSAVSVPTEAAKKNSVDPSLRERRLKMLAMPFDDGPLATAITFVEARDNHWTEDQKQTLVAGALLEKLRKVFKTDSKKADNSIEKPSSLNRQTRLAERLEAPIVSQSINILRGAVVTGQGSLRRDALRGLAVAAVYPEPQDLGAAASTMGDDDPLIKIEAARTYLLLTARATND